MSKKKTSNGWMGSSSEGALRAKGEENAEQRREIDSLALINVSRLARFDQYRVSSGDWLVQVPEAFYISSAMQEARKLPMYGGGDVVEMSGSGIISELLEQWGRQGRIAIEHRIEAATNRLNPIFEAISQGESISALEEDWDGCGARPVSRITWNNAANMLMEYAVYFAEHFDRTLPAPQIDAVPDGSIDLFWKEPKAQLLINIKPDSAHASYYGDTYGDEEKIKGKLPVQGVKEYLAVWMKNLSS